jgi:Uma2 family endonuclease
MSDFIVTLGVIHQNEKRWAIEGRFDDGRVFIMKPDGQVSAKEARAICEALQIAISQKVLGKATNTARIAFKEKTDGHPPVAIGA